MPWANENLDLSTAMEDKNLVTTSVLRGPMSLSPARMRTNCENVIDWSRRAAESGGNQQAAEGACGAFVARDI